MKMKKRFLCEIMDYTFLTASLLSSMSAVLLLRRFVVVLMAATSAAASAVVVAPFSCAMPLPVPFFT